MFFMALQSSVIMEEHAFVGWSGIIGHQSLTSFQEGF
jgi:hypothetical protein